MTNLIMSIVSLLVTNTAEPYEINLGRYCWGDTQPRKTTKTIDVSVSKVTRGLYIWNGEQKSVDLSSEPVSEFSVNYVEKAETISVTKPDGTKFDGTVYAWVPVATNNHPTLSSAWRHLTICAISSGTNESVPFCVTNSQLFFTKPITAATNLNTKH